MEVASLFNTRLASGCEQKHFCNGFVIKNVPKMIKILQFAMKFKGEF